VMNQITCVAERSLIPEAVAAGTLKLITGAGRVLRFYLASGKPPAPEPVFSDYSAQKPPFNLFNGHGSTSLQRINFRRLQPDELASFWNPMLKKSGTYNRMSSHGNAYSLTPDVDVKSPVHGIDDG